MILAVFLLVIFADWHFEGFLKFSIVQVFIFFSMPPSNYFVASLGYHQRVKKPCLKLFLLIIHVLHPTCKSVNR